MESKMSRRLFLGTSLATSSMAFGQVGWIAWLATDAAEDRIFSILKEYFLLRDDQRHLAQGLIKRLRTPGMHTETPAAFQAMLSGGEGADELERYVVEEFVAGSNYIAILKGQATDLEILTT